ncbi:MAG: hypothetical protein CL816_01355 [Coxiellaceae bacterium]|nr:hypothetical protein [Coxiellaceae bacterium]
MNRSSEGSTLKSGLLDTKTQSVSPSNSIWRTPTQNRDNTNSGADHRTTGYVKLDDNLKKSTTPGCIIS